MSGVAILVPIVGRPEHAEPFMTSLRESYRGVFSAVTAPRVYPICDSGDPAAGEWSTWAGRVLVGEFAHQPGSFAEKVNHGYRCTSEPWLFLVGSDVRFHRGWLVAALAAAERTGAQVIGTNDLANDRVQAGEHATHMLVSRRYVDELGASWDGPGVLAHEGYRHWYVDDELVAVARQRGVFTSAPDSVVEHLHPFVGKAEWDDVYRLGQQHSDLDAMTFTNRREANAGA